ncbi:7874_t:CDS:2, partial [Racocetra persica]
DDISETKGILEKVTPAIDVGNFIYYYINNCINCREEECDEQVNNFSSSYYKKFSTIEEANEEFERYQSRIKRKKEKLSSNDKIVIYTDGSHKNNQKGSYASIGVYYEDGSKEITEPLSEDLQTNNRAKLYAVIRALEICEDQYRRPGQVYFIHVFGHKGVTGNELADKLAKQDATIKINEKTIATCWNCLSSNRGVCHFEETTDGEKTWFFPEERKGVEHRSD